MRFLFCLASTGRTQYLGYKGRRNLKTLCFKQKNKLMAKFTEKILGKKKEL